MLPLLIAYCPTLYAVLPTNFPVPEIPSLTLSIPYICANVLDNPLSVYVPNNFCIIDGPSSNAIDVPSNITKLVITPTQSLPNCCV